MKLLVTGGNGQLGQEIARQLREGASSLGPIPSDLIDCTSVFVDVDELDITNQEQTEAFLDAGKYDAVINCAAITNVDACETNEELAFRVNKNGAENLALACEKTGAKLIHVSTDYVFEGTGSTPYDETTPTNPQSVYGKSKLAGEEKVSSLCSRHFIVRTSWLYGYFGNNFVKTILKIAREKGQLKVVNDQLGNPTNAEDLAHHLLRLACTEYYGVYHCTGEGICSWYDFARKIVELGNVPCTVDPCTTEEFPRPAKRPSYSALENKHLKNLGINEMRSWQDALICFFENYKEN